MALSILSATQARILGVLVEKQATVPDTYPLSLNALASGCNQKTAREPVMQLSEAEILSALDDLKSMSLVLEVSGSRVIRYEHNAGRVLGVPSQAVALLATLALRGPQTSAELRAHSERLHRFADVSSVDGFLDELAGKADPLVQKLPRAPGEREARWTHLLCGAADVVPREAATLQAGDDELHMLRAEQRRLSAEVERLRAQVQRLASELGVTLND